MLVNLIYLTGALLALSLAWAWYRYRDVFHPAMLISPMMAFMYVYMPHNLVREESLFQFVSTEQAEFFQTLVLFSLTAFFVGCFWGSSTTPKVSWFQRVTYDSDTVRRGGYVLGAIGVLAWLYVIQNAGGIQVFMRAKAQGWSDNAYIRESAYLMIVGLLLLLSPQGIALRSRVWQFAVVLLALPYLAQGLLGAQRGPTFLIFVTIGMSWYMSRGRRPSILMLGIAGSLLGFLLLFLVVNRGSIYVGSEAELKSDVSEILGASESNEYIFGIGCVTASEVAGKYFWGKRYLAQVLVRPIPRQIWPTKYEDFGVPELLFNAGVAGAGLADIMGWGEVPGAAAGMVADIWVEFSWLCIPVIGWLGWLYGYSWRRAIIQGGPWITQYIIFILLSVYLVSQSGEAVIFRLIILSIGTRYVWRRAAERLPFSANGSFIPYTA